jgi:hypothetical protein
VERLAARPAGSTFTFGTDAEGRVRISWPSVGREHSPGKAVAFLTVWLCGWVAGEVFSSLVLLGMTTGWGPMAGQREHPPLVFLIGWLGAWTVGGIFAWRTWLALVFGRRTESITLGDGELHFRPGLSPEFVVRTGNGWLDGAPSQPPRVIRRGQVASSLRLEPVGERVRLSVDAGAERIELGAALAADEREWLYRLLKDWAGGDKGQFVELSWPITTRPRGG